MIPVSAQVFEPEQGTWVADLDHPDPWDGSFDMGGVSWVGTALSSVQEGPRFRTRAVGGKGKLGSPVRDQYYLGGGTGNTVIGDILRACGETGTPNLSNRVAAWQRAAGTAGQALDQIVGALKGLWWIGRDGEFSAASARPTGEVDLTAWTRVDSDVDGVLSYVGDKASDIVPGKTLDGKVIRQVRWSLTESRLTADVSFEAYGLADLRGGLDYVRSHRAVVESQESDGSLNLIVGNRFSLTRVPWLGGIAGSTKIVAGDVVTVVSWGGDPRSWFATGLIRTPGSPVARVGDTIDCGTLVFSQLPVTPPGAGGTVLFVKQVLPGPNFAQELAAILLTIVPPLVAIQVPITGIVSSGSERNTSS